MMIRPPLAFSAAASALAAGLVVSFIREVLAGFNPHSSAADWVLGGSVLLLLALVAVCLSAACLLDIARWFGAFALVPGRKVTSVWSTKREATPPFVELIAAVLLVLGSAVLFGAAFKVAEDALLRFGMVNLVGLLMAAVLGVSAVGCVFGARHQYARYRGPDQP